MITDFIFMSGGSKPKIKVALGESLNSSKFRFINFSELLVKNSENSNCLDPNRDDIISTPHSNSFADLNGDCMPDIFLTKLKKVGNEFKDPYYEIYT